MAKTIIEKRSLRYDFTASEIHDRALQLAQENQKVTALEDEKKTITSQLQAKINEAKATVNRLSEQVSAGWEYRDIECEVLFHTPAQGKKTIIRKDSNKKTSVETMTEYEWNLFNQPDGDEEEREPGTEDVDHEVVGEEGPKLIGNGEQKQ